MRIQYNIQARYPYSPAWTISALGSGLGSAAMLAAVAIATGGASIGWFSSVSRWLLTLVPVWAIVGVASAGLIGSALALRRVVLLNRRAITETVEITDDTFILRQSFGDEVMFESRFDPAAVRNLRDATEADRAWAQENEWAGWWWVSRGTLAFDYGSATLTFTEGLSPADAGDVLAEIRRSLAARTSLARPAPLASRPFSTPELSIPADQRHGRAPISSAGET